MLTKEVLKKMDKFQEVAIAKYSIVKSMSRILEHGCAVDLLRRCDDFNEVIKNSKVMLVTDDGDRVVLSVAVQ